MLNETDIYKGPTEEILKNNYIESNEKVLRQISGTAVGTKFELPHACIFMVGMETSFLKIQHTAKKIRNL